MEDIRSARTHYGFRPPVSDTDRRLDAVIAELRALRALLTPPEPVETETVELREPVVNGYSPTMPPQAPPPKPRATRKRS